jgi:hypothetical protein
MNSRARNRSSRVQSCFLRRACLAGFQRAEDIKFADESDELVAIIDHWRAGSMSGQQFQSHEHPILAGV